MESTELRPRTVTTIVKDLNPILKDYFNKKLLRFLAMQVRQVHESSTYEPLVVQTGVHSYVGIFYNYLIRREIYYLKGEEAIDHRASKMEKEFEDYNLSSDTENEYEKKTFPVDTKNQSKPVPSDASNETKNDEREVFPEPSVDTERLKPLSDAAKESKDDKEWPVDAEQFQKLMDSYQKFKDSKNATVDIIEHVFNTAMLWKIFYGDAPILFDPKLLNMDNIKTVLEYVSTFDRTNISLNPAIGCEHFLGLANLIMNDVLVQINTSMHRFRVNHDKCRRHMYQLIMYALGVFVREGKEIRKFKVYNPLLGLEYFYEIPHLDFHDLLELVKKVKPL